MKASKSEWSNQRQGDSISYKKFLSEKITCMEMIVILPSYNAMKCMPATINVKYFMPQNISYNPKAYTGIRQL